MEMDKIEGVDDLFINKSKEKGARKFKNAAKHPSAVVIEDNGEVDDDDVINYDAADDDDNDVRDFEDEEEKKSAESSVDDIKQKPGQYPPDQRVNLFSRISLKQQMDNNWASLHNDAEYWLQKNRNQPEQADDIYSFGQAATTKVAANTGNGDGDEERKKRAKEFNDLLPRPLSPSKFKRSKRLLEPLKAKEEM